MSSEINYTQLSNLISELKAKTANTGVTETNQAPANPAPATPAEKQPNPVAEELLKALSSKANTEEAQNAELNALKNTNSEEAKEKAPLKMSTMTKFMAVPEKVPMAMPNNSVLNADSKSIIKEIRDIQGKYAKSQVPILEDTVKAIRENDLVKFASIAFLPTIPVAFLAMADAPLPSKAERQKLSLLQRSFVGSMIKSGQLKQMVEKTANQVDLLNGLNLKTIFNEIQSKRKSKPEQSQAMRLLLNLMLTDQEKASGVVTRAAFNSQVDDTKNNRVAKVKEDLNLLVDYLNKNTEPNKIFNDINSSKPEVKNLDTFINGVLGPVDLFLDEKSEAGLRDIDPFLTNTLGMSEEQVVKLSESFEKTLAGLGVVFDNTMNQLNTAADTLSKEEKLAKMKFAKTTSDSIEKLATSTEVQQGLNAVTNITKEVSQKLPAALDALAKKSGDEC